MGSPLRKSSVEGDWLGAKVSVLGGRDSGIVVVMIVGVTQEKWYTTSEGAKAEPNIVFRNIESNL